MAIKAELHRYTHSGQFSIKVTYPNGDVHDLWDMIVEHCAKTHSNNELKEIYRQCSIQLSKMNPDDVPMSFRELMKELSQSLINRKCFIESVQSNVEEKK